MTTAEATWTIEFEVHNCPGMPDIYGRDKHAEHLWTLDGGFTVYCPGKD